MNSSEPQAQDPPGPEDVTSVTPLGARRSVPGWLIGAIAGGAIVLTLVVAVMVVIFAMGRGGSRSVEARVLEISTDIGCNDITVDTDDKGLLAASTGQSWECETGTGRRELWFMELTDRGAFEDLVDAAPENGNISFRYFGDDLVVMTEGDSAKQMIDSYED